MDNRYLHRRRRGWYIRVAVPPSLVPVVGKSHIVKSLKTRDASEAREKRWPALAEIKGWFAELRDAPIDPVELGLADRRYWLDASDDVADRDPDHGHTPREGMALVFGDTAEEIAERQGVAAATTYYRIATSSDPVLGEVGRRWLEEIKGSISEQTRGHHRSALSLFMQSYPNLVSVSQVDFHSLRRCFATYMERAQNVTLEVNPSVIAELMGHEKPTLTLSVYSGGIRLEGLRKAIEALDQVVEPEVLAAVRCIQPTGLGRSTSARRLQ